MPVPLRAFVRAHVKSIFIFASQLLLGSGTLCAATLTWTGAAGNGNIFTSTNWSPAQTPAAGDTLIFAGSTSLTDTFGSTAFSVASLTFNSTAGAFVLNGTNTLTLSSVNGITNSSAATQTINTNLAFTANQTWNLSAGALVINGIVSGSGSLTKSGAGILTLSGANIYTGNTTLSGGTVQIGNDSAFGTGTINFNNLSLKLEAVGGNRTLSNAYTISATTTFQGAYGLTLSANTNISKSRILTINGTGVLSLTGNIGSGNRSLTKAGTGTLFLSGTNTYSGGYIAKSGTSIIANSASVGTGTLQLGAATFQGSTNALAFSNAVSLIGDTTFAGTPNITFSNTATLTGNRVQTTVGAGLVTYSAAVAGAFTFTKSGSSSMAFTGSSANTYSGLTTVSDGTLLLGKTAGTNAIAGSLTVGDGTGAAGSAVVQWNASNQVADSAAITLNTDGIINLQGFDDTVSSFSATGGSIVGSGIMGLGGNLTFSGTGGAQTSISAGLALNAARIFNIGASGTANADVSISGIISNGSAVSSITKTGAGTLALSGANTFSGGLLNNAGTVFLGSSSALGTAAASLGDTTGSASASYLFNTTTGLTVANAISVRANTGTMTLGGLNTSGTNIFSGAITLANALKLTSETGGEIDLNGAISGAYAVTKIGGGVIKLNSANTYSGGTVLNAGTLLLGTNNALGTGSVTVNSGTLDFGANNSATVGALTLVDGAVVGSGTSTLTTSGVIGVQNGSISLILAGSGSLVKTTAGTVSLSGSDVFTGTTTVSDGTLAMGKPNALPITTDVTVAAPAVLNLQSYATQIGSLSGAGSVILGAGNLTVGNANLTTFSGIISGSGGIAKTGTGTLTLSGANTFSGSTTVSQGTLQLGQNSALNSSTALSLTLTSSTYDLNNFSSTVGSIAGAGNILAGTGTFTFGGDNSTTSLSGIISGSGTITREGSGTTTLSGVSTHSGNLTLNNGRTILSGVGGSLAASSVTIRNGAILDLDSSTTENSNRISNSATVTLSGGTVRLLSDSNGTLESVGSLVLGAGSSAIQVIHNGSSTANNTRLTFSSLGSIASGASVNFFGSGGVLGGDLYGPQIFITGQPLGLLGSWATVGADPAEYSTFGVRAYSDYYEGILGVNYNNTTKLVRLSVNSVVGAYTLTNAGQTTDLGLNLTDVATVDLGTSATRILNLSGGSLIKSTTTASTISGAGILTAGGSASGNLAISVTPGSSLTISSVIANNSAAAIGLLKSDAGTLTLSGTNTFTGNVSLNGGTTNIASESNLGAATSALAFNGGTLRVTIGFTTSPTKVFTVLASQTGTLNIDASQSLIMANTAGGLQSGNAAATLIKTGLGSLVVQSANTGFSGTLQINQGTVELRNAQSTVGGITLNGGTLALAANASTNFNNQINLLTSSTINVDRLSGTGGVTHSTGSLSLGASTLTVSGANAADLYLSGISLLGNATVSPTTANLSSGAISGSFGFNKTGAGIFSLNATNTYAGTTSVSNGTLRMGIADALPSATDLTVASGATVDLAGFSGTTASLSGAGNVTLGSGTFTTGSTSSTFSGSISGTGGLTKSGSGNLTLSGVNSYSGLTSITGGTLIMGGANRISSSSALTVASGATFALNNFDTASASLSGAGSVTLGSATLSTGSSSSTFSGGISGTGSLTKTGAGTLTLTALSTYTGTTNINQGNVVLRNASALGGSSGVNLASGAELQLENNITTASYALNFGGTLRNNSGANSFTGNSTLTGSGNMVSDAGTLTVSGAVTLGGNALAISGAGDTQFSGAISGDGSITKSGAGTTTISGSNIFTGVTIVSAGTLQVRSTGALGATGAGNSTKVLSGATLLLNESSGVIVGAETLELTGTGLGGNGALRSSAGANSWTGAISLMVNASIQVDAGTLELTGGVVESGGTRLLTKSGAGTLVFTGLASHTGGTAITAGTLQLAGNDRLATTGAVDISAGATFNLDDNNQTIGALTGSGFVETGPTAVLTTGGIFTVGNGGSTASFSGSIQGFGDLAKDGTGTQTLAAASTFTGATTINAGQLDVSANNGLGSTSGITINSGGTLLLSGSATDRIGNSVPITLAGGNLARSAGSEGAGSSSTGAGTSAVGLGALSLTANSTIDFGTGAVGTLVFTGFTPGVFTLTINNYSPTSGSTYTDGGSDRLIFNSTQAGNLSNFVFANGGAATQITLASGFYEVTTVVPEPSTWLGAALLTGCGALGMRRHWKRPTSRKS